nr:hypothetical protein [Naasia aerilata]
MRNQAITAAARAGSRSHTGSAPELLPEVERLPEPRERRERLVEHLVVVADIAAIAVVQRHVGVVAVVVGHRSDEHPAHQREDDDGVGDHEAAPPRASLGRGDGPPALAAVPLVEPQQHERGREREPQQDHQADLDRRRRGVEVVDDLQLRSQ